MKRITLFIAILFTFNMGFAQEEVAIEQRIEQPINRLEIYRGWDVHLLHNEADSGYRVAIVTNEDYAPFAFNVQLCNVKGDTLTILENTQLPQGTVVEVEGPMTFQHITLMVIPSRAGTPRQTAPATPMRQARKSHGITMSHCTQSGRRTERIYRLTNTA